MKQKTIIKKLSAIALALGLCAASILFIPSVTGNDQVQADEQVRSVYTNEPIPAAQASLRPIAVMMPVHGCEGKE